MFRKKYPDYALIFAFDSEKIIPITMWFCFFSLDLLFLDKNLKVVEKKGNLLPWKNYWPQKKAMYVVELPAGSGKKINIGNKIKISGL